VIELIVRGPVPGLVSITGIAALVVVSAWGPKARLVGLNAMPGTVVDPVPVRLTSKTWVLVKPPFVTTAVITRVADSAAATEGVNVTLTVHVAAAATLGLQSSDDFAKSVLAAGDTPVTTILLNVIVEPVLFVATNACAGVGTLSCSTPKSNGEGATVRDGVSVSSAT
jgi:hypothetical protein